MIRLALGPLEAAERRLVDDRRNRAACSRSLSRVAGRSLTLDLVVPDEGEKKTAGAGSRRGERKPAERDPLTQQVADLFGGVIEDV